MQTKLFVIVLFTSTLLFAQNEKENNDRLVSNTKFYGVQIEALAFLTVYEVGLSADFDFMSSKNKKYNLGMRLSGEYYNYVSLDVGGKTAPGPFLDFGMYAFHTIAGKHFGVTSFLGLSFHNSLEENKNTELLLLPRGGIEWKYNLRGDELFIFLKLATSFREETTVGGFGIVIRLNND